MKKHLILTAAILATLTTGAQAADQIEKAGLQYGHTTAQVDVTRWPVAVKLGGICANLAEAMNAHEKDATQGDYDLVIKMTSTNSQLTGVGCGYNSMPLFTTITGEQTLAGQSTWVLKTDVGLPAVLIPLLDSQINAEFDQEFDIARFDSGSYLFLGHQRNAPKLLETKPLAPTPAPASDPIKSSLKSLGNFLTSHAQ
jgi:hypothetical protein